MTEVKSRILKTENVRWKDLKIIQPSGFKDLSKEAYAKLRQSILTNNFIDPFKIWENCSDLYVVDGVHRIKVLNELEKEGHIVPQEFPANFISCKDRKEAAKLVLVYSSIYAHVQEEGLYEFLHSEELNFEELKLEIDLPELDLNRFEDGWMRDAKEDDFDVEQTIRKPKYEIKMGDIFELGSKDIKNFHRLMCGDSTKREDVEKLISGNQADIVFTDPPYGVSYADKNIYLNSISRGNRIQTEIENDHKNMGDLADNIIYPSFCRIKENLKNDASYYITAPQGGDLLMMMMMMQKAGLVLRHMLIWVKNNHVLGRTDYNYKHEPILFGWIDRHNFYGYGEHKFSTWEIDKPLKSDLHPTMKPISLVVNSLLNSSKQDDLCLDLFGGSGTTLIACQQTNRICYMMEIDPIYISVILERYINYVGTDEHIYRINDDGGKTPINELEIKEDARAVSHV